MCFFEPSGQVDFEERRPRTWNEPRRQRLRLVRDKDSHPHDPRWDRVTPSRNREGNEVDRWDRARFEAQQRFNLAEWNHQNIMRRTLEPRNFPAVELPHNMAQQQPHRQIEPRPQAHGHHHPQQFGHPDIERVHEHHHTSTESDNDSFSDHGPHGGGGGGHHGHGDRPRRLINVKPSRSKSRSGLPKGVHLGRKGTRRGGSRARNDLSSDDESLVAIRRKRRLPSRGRRFEDNRSDDSWEERW